MAAWITLPPFVSLPIALVLFIIGGQSSPVSIGVSFWALLLIVYFILCGAYAAAIQKGLFRLLTSLQLLTQGLIATAVSLESGTLPIIPWTGVLAAATGSIILLHAFLRGGSIVKAGDSPFESEWEAPPPTGPSSVNIPLPTVTTDSKGVIVEANEAFSALVGQETPPGSPVTDFFIPGETTATFNGRQFSVFQAPVGGLFFFAFMEYPSERRGGGGGKNSVALRDQHSGLYSRQYADIRIPEELSRASRYRRWLSGVLLAVQYTYSPGQNYQEDQEKSFFQALSAFILQNIRGSDVAFNMDGGKILILLPETPQQGAKEVSLKLKDLPEPLLELIDSAPFTVAVDYGFLYYSGNYSMNQDQFLEKINESLKGASE